MITKGASYIESDNKFTMAEFGQGTIMIVLAAGDDFMDVGFKTSSPYPIGEVTSHECFDMREYNPGIVFRFTKTEAIDALILTLMEGKELLQKVLIENKTEEDGTENS